MSDEIDIPTDNWRPIEEVMEILHHPDFRWHAHEDLWDLKYIELRIDTRSNYALIHDSHGKPVDLEKIRQAIKGITVKNWNSNTR